MRWPVAGVRWALETMTDRNSPLPATAGLAAFFTLRKYLRV